jgi:hypothetical protein
MPSSRVEGEQIHDVVIREGSLAGGKAVDGVVVGHRMALHEPVDHQLALDGLDGADDPRIIVRGNPTRASMSRLESSRSDP